MLPVCATVPEFSFFKTISSMRHHVKPNSTVESIKIHKVLDSSTFLCVLLDLCFFLYYSLFVFFPPSRFLFHISEHLTQLLMILPLRSDLSRLLIVTALHSTLILRSTNLLPKLKMLDLMHAVGENDCYA